MNAFDHLLEWASEVGFGSWQSWRDACSYLGIEANTAARRLSALGHVEFDWIDDHFGVTPPAAILTLHSSGCLLLTGARRRGARELLEQQCEDGEYDIDLRVPVSQESGPATWLVEAEVDEMERFCSDSGFKLEIDSGRRIAESLPLASLERCGEEGRPDPRFVRKWFDLKLGLFRADIPPSWDGLWWIEEHRRAIAFVRRNGDWFRVPTREYGPYLAYPSESFITHHRGLSHLTVENVAPLPALLARAATLQSGRLARRDSSTRHTYVNIDEDLAELIQDKLDTPLDWR